MTAVGDLGSIVPLVLLAGLTFVGGLWLGRGRAAPQKRPRGRRLIDSMRGFAIYGLDDEGRIASWNAGAEDLCGYRADEARGQAFTLLEPTDQKPTAKTLLDQARQDGRAEAEGWCLRKDGNRFWAHWVITAQPESAAVAGGIRFVIILHDITLRRVQDERIRFQAALLNRVRSAIIATDSAGAVVYMNATAEDLFGLPWQEAEGQDLRGLALFPDLLDGPDGPLPGAAGHRLEREVSARRRDGSTFPALCLTTISPDPGGNGHAEVHLIHDLSETQRMRDALQHTANLALLGRMSASLVHEISQPMNVIRLTAEGSVMKLERGELDSAALRERFHTIADQAARLFDTIDFMQTFSRLDSAMGIGSKSGPAAPVAMDLARSTREAVSVIAPALGTVTVTIQGPEAGCWVRGKPPQIEQVLINLLSNALQAVADRQSKGEIRLTLGPTSTQNRPGWQVAVEDNGPGIPQGSRGAIFEPFFTTKPAGQGTGLGLAISLGIARTMGGVIEAGDSQSLGGACLTLWLPAAEAPAAEIAAPVQTQPMGCSEGHILLVEDEDLARQEMGAALGDLGYKVSTASGGAAAQALLATAAETAQPVDLVVTDLRMADGDGYSLLAHLEEDYPQVFTIVVTGQPLRDREALAERGVNADEVLRKPVDLDRLGAVVAGLLGGQ